jgi:hypothetical protein
MALRDASNDASAGGQPPGSAAKLRELQSRCVSNDRTIARRARIVVTRRIPRTRHRKETATDGLFAPRRARAQDGSNATDERERGRDDEREETNAVECETIESAERVRCVRRAMG